jgi:ubiquinone/menaquinone biosynthesis C-methylase UbiE
MVDSSRDITNDQSKIIGYYQNDFEEESRLRKDDSAIELVRTQDIIIKNLPKPPARILDVGGGPGIYSSWLAQLGYKVQLVDIVLKHVEQAQKLSDTQPESPFAVELGDAMHLSQDNGSQEIVLELGPLYHLIEKEQRIKALTEAYRVLNKGGLVFVAAIGRYASLFSGLLDNILDDPDFSAIVQQDIKDGRHLPRSSRYFTTAYFHRVEELENEIKEAKFSFREILAVEGPFWLLTDLSDRWQNLEKRRQLLFTLTQIEKDPSILGTSLHIIGIGQKP